MTIHKGAAAEQRAALFLQRQKLQLLEKNYRCRFGEIDLVMRENDTVVFVEVRQRSSDRFGGAAASITSAKQQKLVLAAQHYLARHGNDYPCRFDAVLISGDKNDEIEWIRNAFEEG